MKVRFRNRCYRIPRIRVFASLLMTTFVAITTCVSLASMPKTNAVDTNAQFVYLSDIKAKSTKVGYGSLGIDKASDGSKISMRVEGTPVTFNKGLFAHATSNLIYDLAGYEDFDYFTAYLGINTSSNKGNGVKFFVYTSNDYSEWTLEECGLPEVTMPGTDATFVKVSIKDKRYLWLKVDANGANGNDHSAYGDAKLVKASYKENVVTTVEEYDEIIKQKFQASGGVMTDDLELAILQRDLVKSVGQYQLKQLFEDGDDNEEAFNFVFNDLGTMRLFMNGGRPDGTYRAAFGVLAELLKAHKEDLNDDGISAQGVRYGDIYKKMMLTLSLTHSRSVYFWVSASAGPQGADPYGILSQPVLRYEIYKDMLKERKLVPMFDTLQIEEMRYVMGSQINDDEIKWARDYAVSKGSSKYSGYTYMNYVNISPTNYRKPEYFDPSFSAYKRNYNVTQPDGTVWTLDDYGVKRVAYYPRLWTVMENGGVCWQISNVGVSMTNAMGQPSMLTGQPGHSSYIILANNANGDGQWSLWNDVGGWETLNVMAYNGTRGSFANRLMIGWGNDSSYASGHTATYIFLAQAAMNDYENFEKSEARVRMAGVLTDFAAKEAQYRQALAIQSVNWNAWMGLLNLYRADSSKTHEDFYNLAVEAAEALAYYPHPMYDMLRLIEKEVAGDAAYMAAVSKLTDMTLRDKAMKATIQNVVQYSEAQRMAKFFLGKLDTEVATFSFDGEEAGVLKLSTKYEGTQAAFNYRLSADDSWNTSPVIDNGKVKLSPDEIAKINKDFGIEVHIMGVNYDEVNIYRIAISEGVMTSGLYGNDNENRVVGDTSGLEWRMEGSQKWTNYAEETPDLTGEKIVYLRKAATGKTLPSPTEQKFVFHTDEDDVTHTYITIDNLTVASFSSETNRKGQIEIAENALDANLNTHWHTDRTSTTDEKFMVIELAEERFVSRFEYVPMPNYYYGLIKDADVLVSRDGENWTTVAEIRDWERNDAIKKVDFAGVLAKFVKIQVIKNYDYVLRGADANWFVNAAMFNLYEDRTKSSLPMVRLEYDNHNLTNEDVTVKLVNTEPEIPITIDNNDGRDTYTFSRNGEFEFEFSTDKGNGEREHGKIKAKVSWIDKVAPVANVRYEKTVTSNEDGDAQGKVEGVIATIRFNENVKLLNSELTVVSETITDAETGVSREVIRRYVFENGDVLERKDDGSLTYMFVYNHEFTLRFADEAGNEGGTKVKVDTLTVTDGAQDESVNNDEEENVGDDNGDTGEPGGDIKEPEEDDKQPGENKPSDEKPSEDQPSEGQTGEEQDAKPKPVDSNSSETENTVNMGVAGTTVKPRPGGNGGGSSSASRPNESGEADNEDDDVEDIENEEEVVEPEEPEKPEKPVKPVTSKPAEGEKKEKKEDAGVMPVVIAAATGVTVASVGVLVAVRRGWLKALVALLRRR